MGGDELKESVSPAPREKLEAQIKSADMTEDMQQEAVEVAQEAMAKFTVEKDIAQHIKKTVGPYPSSATTNGLGFGSILVMGLPG
uniref:Probable dynein light chain, cytoplasmic n=1 Tax=Neurospora crassa TaxID=5141 RepID=Q6MV46_NEUCS|nr:probable dynein light chain, cytoplasmic [Neurospora crassa]